MVTVSSSVRHTFLKGVQGVCFMPTGRLTLVMSQTVRKSCEQSRARGDHRYIFERHLSTTEQHRWRTKVVSSDALLVRLRGTGVHEVRLVAPPGALKKVHLD